MFFQIVGRITIIVGICLVTVSLVGGTSQLYGAGCTNVGCDLNTCAPLREPDCGDGGCSSDFWYSCWNCSCQTGSIPFVGKKWCVCNYQ